MRLMRRAGTLKVAIALSLAATACGGDDTTGPHDFDPIGTTADLVAMQSAFTSDVVQSFRFAGSHIASAINGSVTAAASVRSLQLAADVARVENRRGARAPRPHLAALLAPAHTGVIVLAAIPDEYRGKTFEYDAAALEYVVTGGAGAPADGARFLLYKVDPATGQVVLPLNAVGHVDLVEASVSSVRIVVRSALATMLDYTVTASETSTSGTVTVAGYVTSGTTRVEVHLAETVSGTTYAVDYDLAVPSRDLAVAFDMTQEDGGTRELTMRVEGGNGRIDLVGEDDNTTTELTVTVNGDDFATLQQSGDTEPSIDRIDGEPLGSEEVEAFEEAYRVMDAAVLYFLYLALPAEPILG